MATMTEEEKKRKGLLGLSNMDAVKQGAMDDVRTRWNSGDVAGAAGAFVRGSLATVPAWVADSNANTAATLAPIGNAVGRFGSGLIGGDTPDSAATAATPAAPAQTVASPRTVGVQAPVQPGVQSMDVGPATEGLAGLEQYRVKSAPAATNDIKKTVDANGNVTYSGSNIGPNATINGKEAGGGYMEVPGGAGSAGLPGASGLAGVRGGIGVQTPIGTFQSADAATMAANLRDGVDVYRGTSMANRANPDAMVQQAAGLLTRGQVGDTKRAQTLFGAAATLGDAQAQQAKAAQDTAYRNAQLGLDARKLAVTEQAGEVDRARTNLAMDGERQIAELRKKLVDPEATDEQRVAAQRGLLALLGKQEQANRFTVVPGGQQIDPISGKVYTTPSQVLNNQTGQFMQQPGAQDQAQQTYEVGKIYTDANGNRRRWDGKGFVPV